MRGETFSIAAFVVGAAYSRSEIALTGGVEPPSDPRDPHWSTGIISFDNVLALLVTLEKEEGYRDYFEGRQFWWQSQNRQTASSSEIVDMLTGARSAVLFVRQRRKSGGETEKFVYCGRLSRPEIEGERPVTCYFDCLDYVEDATGVLGELYDWRPDGPVSESEIIRKNIIRTRTARGQGRQLDPAMRKAIEMHGMRVASQHYRSQGYTVTDTSQFRPWDLEVKKIGDTRRVEVKATQSTGEQVSLTAGEVRAAWEPGVVTDLFLVYSVEVLPNSSPPSASGGKTRLIEAWRPESSDLIPTDYRYRLPAP